MKSLTLIVLTLLLSATSLAQAPAGAAKPFEVLDTNSDGRISATEAQADPELAAKFSMLDKQGRGYITKAEYETYVKSQKN